MPPQTSTNTQCRTVSLHHPSHLDVLTGLQLRFPSFSSERRQHPLSQQSSQPPISCVTGRLGASSNPTTRPPAVLRIGCSATL